MKLSQALKEKNKLTKELSEIQKVINQHNSIIKGNTRQFNIDEMIIKLDETTNKLVSLKEKIALANAPINQHIIKMGELRSQIAFLKKLDVRDGHSSERYGSVVLEYDAHLKQPKVMSLIKSKEIEIDNLQEIVDTHNHTVNI